MEKKQSVPLEKIMLQSMVCKRQSSLNVRYYFIDSILISEYKGSSLCLCSQREKRKLFLQDFYH